MKKWQRLIMSMAVMLGIIGAVVPASSVSAVDVFQQCKSNSTSAVCKAKNTDNLGSMVRIVINTILIVLGMIAVIMIIVGGFRYTTSNGDSAAITSAKNTILYAVIGLIVAMMSYAIVNFVIDQFK